MEKINYNSYARYMLEDKFFADEIAFICNKISHNDCVCEMIFNRCLN